MRKLVAKLVATLLTLFFGKNKGASNRVRYEIRRWNANV